MKQWRSMAMAATAACVLLVAAARSFEDNITEEAPTAPRLRSSTDSCEGGCYYEAPSVQANGRTDQPAPAPHRYHTVTDYEKPTSEFSHVSDLAAGSDLAQISEIESLVIRDVNASNPIVRPLTKRTDRLYVAFAHRGRRRGTSLPLNDLLKPSLVTLPILDTDEARREPVRCTIMRDRKFRPDQKLFTADVIFRHSNVWHDANGDGVVDADEESTRRELTGTGVIRDMKGRDTGAVIELELFQTQYLAATVEGNKVNKPAKIDLYYRVFTAALPLTLKRFFVGKGTDGFSKPKDAANPNLPLVSLLDGAITYPKRDEFEPPPNEVWAVRILNRILPFTKRNNVVKDRVIMRNNVRVNTLGENIKGPWEGTWHDPLSDKSMTRLFFYHQGHFKTRVIGSKDIDRYQSVNGVRNAYVADLTFFTPYKHRDDFENLGCKVYFNHNAEITLIENTDGSAVFPGTPRWEHVKQKARSSLFTEVALIHLNHFHLNWGNVPSQALRMFLPPTHPLRIALTTHFFRTHQTCLQSRDFLVAKRGPLGRALPFDYEQGWKPILQEMMYNFRFKFWPDEIAERGIDFTVGATDAIGLHAVMTKYASGLVDEAYPHISLFEKDADLRKAHEFLVEHLPGVPAEYTMDNVGKVWGEILFRVTGGHASVGNAAISAIEPFFVNFRQTTNDDWKIVAGSREVISTVSTITGLTMPNQYPNLLTNWTHLLHDEDSAAYAQLQLDLTALGDEIDERNKHRDFVNLDFHPEIAQISIFSHGQLNIGMGTEEGSPERAVGPRSVGGGGRRRRRPPLATAVSTCVILLAHQPLPAIGASPSSLHLRPPPTVEQYRASRRTRRRDERRDEAMRHRRRRNNTGFYFGLRDDDIVSCSSGSGPPSRRMEPALLSDGIATRHCLTRQWTAMGDVAIENGHREETMHELYSDGTGVEQTAPGPLPVGECNQHNGISALDSPKRFLRQFANHLRPLDRRRWNELWEQRCRMPQLKRLSTSVGKAVSLLGGGSTIISWEDGQNQPCHHVSENGGVVVQASTATKQRKKLRTRRKNNTGFYYGIREDVLVPPSPGATAKRLGKAAPVQQPDGSAADETKPPAEEKGLPLPPAPKNDPPARKQREKESRPKKQNTKPKKKSNGDVAPGMSDVFGETLLELREMREEIVALREELKAMKGKMKRDKQGGVAVDAPPPSAEEEPPLEDSTPKVSKRERQRGFDRIGKDVEQWAVDLLFGQDDRAGDGWKEISCNNFVKKKFNRSGRTEVYLKWMPDTRDDGDIESTSSRTQEYPCLKCYSTIDAPIEDVCSFLANEETMPLYNELVTDHAEVEEITPHGKITWTKCPKILFVKPRDFVTYCSHRWRRDGAQVLINQACEHEDRPAVLEEGQADACRGFALRGANFISRDPDDPTKTRFTMLSHANPGGGLPQWAMNTAVNAVVQIEPFKFFHNINDSICNYQESPTLRTSVVKNIPGRSSKPAGIAHLGFTCFWPNGGGLKEIDQQDGLEREEEMIGFDD